MTIFSTYIRTDDGLVKIVPNDNIWKSVIVNQTTGVVKAPSGRCTAARGKRRNRVIRRKDRALMAWARDPPLGSGLPRSVEERGFAEQNARRAGADERGYDEQPELRDRASV